MKCQNCNSELVSGARFCDACGAPVEQLPTASTPPAAYTPPSPTPVPVPPEPQYPPAPTYSTPYSVPVNEGKVLGMPASQMGTISLVIGAVGLLFSCIGCGGILSLLGLVAGILAQKTSSKSNGKIGIILSAIGLVISIIMVCLLLTTPILGTFFGGDYNNQW